MGVSPGRKFSGSAPQPVSGALAVSSALPAFAAHTGGAKRKQSNGNQGMNYAIKLVVTASNVPLQAEPLAMPRGSVARVRTNGTNTDAIVLASSRQELLLGMGQPISPDSETVFPFDKGRLWYMGANVGDVAVLSVRSE